MISLSNDGADALARTARSEVGHFGKYGASVLKGGVEAVIDTIINRVAHLGFPNSIDGVVNQKYQFSAIGGPGGTGTWKKLKPAGTTVTDIVEQHLQDRVQGKHCTVQGATHFLNPYLSSKTALTTWGNHVVKNAVAVWGNDKKKDVHYHGFAPGSKPPSDYSLEFEGIVCEFNGKGAPKPVAMLATQSDDLSAGRGLEESGGGMPVTNQLVGLEETPVYRVERITPDRLPDLQATLNEYAEEGWRLRQIVPDSKALLVVLESFRIVDGDTEVDESIVPGVVDSLSEAMARGATLSSLKTLVAPAPEAGGFDMGAFSKLLQGLNLKYFEPHEFLVLGNQHFSGPCKGKNTLPPENLWNNILPTAKVLDAVREKLNSPIRTLSVYRSPAYNACIPGAAGGSVHMKFMAVDFKCEDGKGPVHWAKILKRMRDSGMFKGGIGVYSTFVHVDTRGTNANFGPLAGSVF